MPNPSKTIKVTIFSSLKKILSFWHSKSQIIFGQNVEAGIEAKDVKNITLTISDGVNYDKKVIIGSLVGQDIKTLKETINSLHLNNVKIQYKTDE